MVCLVRIRWFVIGAQINLGYRSTPFSMGLA
jgi:hypothetical protein